MTIRAAGIMFLTDEGQVLLLKRGAGGDHPGEWCFPGGRAEEGEDLEDAAVREAREELGPQPYGRLVQWTRQIKDGIDFTTFVARIKQPFVPKVEGEHVGWMWVNAQALNSDLSVIPENEKYTTPAPVTESRDDADGKFSQDLADYTDDGGMADYCAVCVHFEAPQGCTLVNGPISPEGWCRFFDRDLRIDAVFRESEHPRDEDGKFTEGGGGVKLSRTKDRAFTGKQVATKTTLSKQQAGALGERIIRQHINAQPLNMKAANFPVDMISGNNLIEVKTGLVSNGPSAQKWRATIGQPGKAETEWLKTASPDAKAAWNAEKMKAIMQRKQNALRTLSKETGRKLKPMTVTTIINPDTKTADVFQFEGFHLHIRWGSDETKKAYVGSYRYEEGDDAGAGAGKRAA